MKPKHVWQMVVSLLLVVSLTTGCAGNAPRFVDEGARYSADQALELPLDINAGAVAGRPTSEAAKLRVDSLAALRRQGSKEAAAATLITKTIPLKSSGVPVYVEVAEVDGVPAVIVVEAVGPKGGKLEDKRVWVLDPSGKVLLMGNR